ncbi:MAG: AAA family ATPase [Haloarculaceae archaeon]
MSDEVCALVGTTGGAGTTRLALEFGATLAGDDRSVLVVDAAYATQGLVTAVPGRVDPDVTRAVTDDRPLAAATTDLDTSTGRLAVAPARAPFERLSRAKTSECARRLAGRIGDATREFDHVLVDVPPVAANQAVAAVTAADRVGLVVPDTQRGIDALPRTLDRLADVDAGVDAVVANRTGETPQVEDADASVPESETTALADAPVCPGDGPVERAVADAVARVVGADVDRSGRDSSLTDYLPG